MRQKLYATLAVAVLTLSGARETCKHFNELKSLAGEWSGAWNTMLVYAGAYAEGLESRPAPTMLAASHTVSCRGESAAAVARNRRARVRQTPAARRDAPADLRPESAKIACGPVAKPEAAHKILKSRLRAPVGAGEIAAAFHTDFGAQSLRTLATGREIKILRAPLLDGRSKRERAVVEPKVARIGVRNFGNHRVIVRLPELPGVNPEALRAVEAAAEVWPASTASSSGPEGLGEDEVIFVAPQSSSSGLLNCDAQPRR